MSVTVRSQSTGTFAANGSYAGTYTFPKPSGLAVGDLMVAWVGGVAGTMSAPDNTWTSGYKDSINASTYVGCAGSLWYKVATSTDVSASSFVFGTGNGTVYGVLVALTGQAASSPVNVVAGTSNTAVGGSQSIPAPSVTTTADGCQLYTFFVVNTNGMD